MSVVNVLREFIGWWPVTVTLDGQPATDGTAVELVALPTDVRPTDPANGAVWKPGHVNNVDQLCVWLDAVADPGTYLVYGRPTPVAPEAPVYELDGQIFRT
jgi:hypothetical protein